MSCSRRRATKTSLWKRAARSGGRAISCRRLAPLSPVGLQGAWRDPRTLSCTAADWHHRRRSVCRRRPRARSRSRHRPRRCRRPSISRTIPSSRPFVWRSIGPANMGGRVDDIAVVESNPSIIYVGFATGGIWKTTNNGTTWTPIFDQYPVSSIGDIAIAPSNPDIIYVGTGEAEQPPELLVRRRRLQVDRRRQDVRVHRAEGHPEHRPHRRPPEGSEHRLRRGARAPVRAEPRARPLQDDRRRQDLDEHQVHRQRHRLHRRGDGSVEPERAVRRVVPAPADAVGLQRRRPGQRPLEDDRRRQEAGRS